MLKQIFIKVLVIFSIAATFGWLCVETRRLSNTRNTQFAATFGWLCVETLEIIEQMEINMAATFGWLCVETAVCEICTDFLASSHLRVAVC